MNTVPVFEAKNKLPFFIHQAESGSPVFISRRDKSVAVLISIDNYNSLVSRAQKKKPGIVERAAELRKQFNCALTDDEIDEIFSSAKDTSTKGTSWEDDIFKGVFDN